MGKIAFVFSGQGDQHPGMGRELFDKYAEARHVFELCDGIRPGTSNQCFFGTADELMVTANTQPCLFAFELAAARVLESEGVMPDAVAGFSLGEVAAATASGLFDEATGFALVCKRGELMQREAEEFDTSMAAVVKLTEDKVRELCAKYDAVYPVNFNCPGQITVAGLRAQMGDFAADVKNAGGRAIPLKVGGGFHSPFMDEASSAFGVELARVTFGDMRVPLYSNVTGEVYAGDAADLLARQIASPVLWEKIVRGMIASGVDTFIEIGPGKTLTNMIKKIDAGVTAVNFMEMLEKSEGVC